MLYNVLLKNGIVYVPTVTRLKTGAYMDSEPVAVVSAADTPGVCRALLEAISRGNVVVPNPTKGNWPPPVLLKYAGAKTWSAFARGASYPSQGILGGRPGPKNKVFAGYGGRRRDQPDGGYPAGGCDEEIGRGVPRCRPFIDWFGRTCRRPPCQGFLAEAEAEAEAEAAVAPAIFPPSAAGAHSWRQRRRWCDGDCVSIGIDLSSKPLLLRGTWLGRKRSLLQRTTRREFASELSCDR